MLVLIILAAVILFGWFLMRRGGPAVGGPFLVWGLIGVVLILAVIIVRSLS